MLFTLYLRHAIFENLSKCFEKFMMTHKTNRSNKVIQFHLYNCSGFTGTSLRSKPTQTSENPLLALNWHIALCEFGFRAIFGQAH